MIGQGNRVHITGNLSAALTGHHHARILLEVNKVKVISTKNRISKKLNLTKEDQEFLSGKNKIPISDPTKTIIDGLNDPAVFGGVRMLSDILQVYLESEEFDLKKFLIYAKKMNNSAIFKRLGFLLGSSKLKKSMITLIETCRAQIKTGYSQLDPSTPGKYLVTAWNLWVPQKNWKNHRDQ